jgi:cell division protease FtsH
MDQSSRSEDYSEQTAHAIDCEVRRIIDDQYDRVHNLLEVRLEALRQAASRLLQQEVMSGEELREIVAQVDFEDLEASVADAIKG